ncbi:MAG: 3-isopropylmalate dehydratase small subunit [Propionibacteriaceae bacterium]|nr:3-isopropylmalate dehydratase small subunit [Propionibacteriaceae bacterium]
MKAFTTHTGVPVPLRRSGVDTDQIIPAVYLKRITRTGFEDGLFFAWRSDPEFLLNKSPYDKGTILVAGPDFGIGSSREHAVWALQDYGFVVVVAPRFGDIFRNNSGKSGLLLATVDDAVVHQLWDAIEAAPGQPMTVSLEQKTITLGEMTVPFAIDDYTAARLLAGLDDIGATLEHEAEITAYEAKRPSFLPVTAPMPA